MTEGALLGRFEVMERLSEGGMGVVYLVRHLLLNEIQIVKTIQPRFASDPEFRERFLREARLATQLRHPNVAQIFDFAFADDGSACLVMEYIQGRTLLNLISEHGRLALSQALLIAQQSLRGLAYLHRNQVVHRDVATDNLMLTLDSEGEAVVKLIDLGLARAVQSESGLTAEASFLGKVRFASPEQFQGDGRRIGPWSDVYSFAVVLYELLTGRHPIRGDDVVSLMTGHLLLPPLDFEETDPEGRVPVPLRRAVERALSKDPSARFENAAEFSEALLADPSMAVLVERGRREARELLTDAVRARAGALPPRPPGPTLRSPAPGPWPLEATAVTRPAGASGAVGAGGEAREAVLVPAVESRVRQEEPARPPSIVAPVGDANDVAAEPASRRPALPRAVWLTAGALFSVVLVAWFLRDNSPPAGALRGGEPRGESGATLEGRELPVLPARSAAETAPGAKPAALVPEPSSAAVAPSRPENDSSAAPDRADSPGEPAPAVEAVSPIQPRKISGEDPIYVKTAREVGLEGEVDAELRVLENGRVDRVRIQQGLSASQDREVVETLRQWRYQPATRAGAAIASDHAESFVFELGLPEAPNSSDPGIEAPRRLTVVEPKYTDQAQEAGTEGEVVADLFIDAAGAVQAVRLVSGLPDGLNESAAQAFRQWRYSPATRSGAVIAVRHRDRIEFKLE